MMDNHVSETWKRFGDERRQVSFEHICNIINMHALLC